MSQLVTDPPPVKPIYAKAQSGRLKIMTVALMLVVLAVALAGSLINQAKGAGPEADGYGSLRSAAQISGPAAISVGNANAPHRIDVYEDPLCPYCSLFEHRFGQLLARAADSGKVKITYHLLTFLDPKSAGKSYSTRAANALMCTARTNGAAFGPLHDRLMSPGTQPKENGATDLTDDELIRFAREAGAEIADCVRGMPFAGELTSATAATRPTIPGTPTIKLDGKTVENPLADKEWAAPLN